MGRSALAISGDDSGGGADARWRELELGTVGSYGVENGFRAISWLFQKEVTSKELVELNPGGWFLDGWIVRMEVFVVHRDLFSETRCLRAELHEDH